MKARSTKLRTLLQGVGLGVLVTFHFMMYLVSPYHEMLYLHPAPLYGIYLGAIADLAAIAVLWMLVSNIKNAALWPFLWTGIVVIGIYDLSQLLDLSISRWTLAGIATASLVCLRLILLNDAWSRLTDQALRACLVLIGFSGLWMIPEMAYIATRSAGHETTAFRKTPKSTEVGASPRIVWLVLDELSYDKVYEHRWPGLSLVNFDRLRRQSVTFTNVQPAGYYTVNVIPSLFLGRTVSEVKTTSGGKVAVYLKDVQEWRGFDPAQTIFADARRLGWSSGISGWYNPYCRILADWVDSCWWSDQQPFRDDMNPRHTVWMNAAAPFLYWLKLLMPGVLPDRFSYWSSLVDGQTRDYQSGLERAEALLRDHAVRFKYIHLDVPHLPSIYDRKKRTFSIGGSYIDNLALADEALGRLLDLAEADPSWPQTTLIVCGDHSWRTPIWKIHAATWTPEDEAASGGRFDPRPVLSIHFPNQQRETAFTGQFSALALHDIIEDLLRQKTESKTSLSSWVDAIIARGTLGINAS
jgi:hypothetical protein